MKFSYFDINFEVIPKIDKRLFYFHYGHRHHFSVTSKSECVVNALVTLTFK
jgi:hypothetical protein